MTDSITDNPIVRDPEPAVCASCYQRIVRKGSRFCTQRCAAEWADAMTESQVWDGDSGQWTEEGATS